MFTGIRPADYLLATNLLHINSARCSTACKLQSVDFHNMFWFVSDAHMLSEPGLHWKSWTCPTRQPSLTPLIRQKTSSSCMPALSKTLTTQPKYPLSLVGSLLVRILRLLLRFRTVCSSDLVGFCMAVYGTSAHAASGSCLTCILCMQTETRS